jgi:hypothetical protein
VSISVGGADLVILISFRVMRQVRQGGSGVVKAATKSHPSKCVIIQEMLHARFLLLIESNNKSSLRSCLQVLYTTLRILRHVGVKKLVAVFIFKHSPVMDSVLHLAKNKNKIFH